MLTSYRGVVTYPLLKSKDRFTTEPVHFFLWQTSAPIYTIVLRHRLHEPNRATHDIFFTRHRKTNSFETIKKYFTRSTATSAVLNTRWKLQLRPFYFCSNWRWQNLVGSHFGLFNAPTSNEIDVVIYGQQHNRRGIILQCRGNNMQRIRETYRSWDAFQ